MLVGLFVVPSSDAQGGGVRWGAAGRLTGKLGCED